MCKMTMILRDFTAISKQLFFHKRHSMSVFKHWCWMTADPRGIVAIGDRSLPVQFVPSQGTKQTATRNYQKLQGKIISVADHKHNTVTELYF